jgi:hypothetical protein
MIKKILNSLFKKNTYDKLYLENAASHAGRHRSEIEQSSRCGCYYCLQLFAPSEITNWINETYGEAAQTALCPKCGIDAVIGSASGLPIENLVFLKEMFQYYFK